MSFGELEGAFFNICFVEVTFIPSWFYNYVNFLHKLVANLRHAEIFFRNTVIIKWEFFYVRDVRTMKYDN